MVEHEAKKHAFGCQKLAAAQGPLEDAWPADALDSAAGPQARPGSPPPAASKAGVARGVAERGVASGDFAPRESRPSRQAAARGTMS